MQLSCFGRINGRIPARRDFKANHFTWDDQLCLLDSDGDGETNGMELGDPCCGWRAKGERNVPRVVGHLLSHPGDPHSRANNYPAPSTLSREELLAKLSIPQANRTALFTAAGFQCGEDPKACGRRVGFYKDREYGACKMDCPSNSHPLAQIMVSIFGFLGSLLLDICRKESSLYFSNTPSAA